MAEELRVLPIGLQNFASLRKDNLLYVDKTGQLSKLVDNVRRCFLSRPRRFGKSLTLSTLDAMFSGRVDLFKGLAAEEWVQRQASCPTPVLRIDMSSMDNNSQESLRLSIEDTLNFCADERGLSLRGRTLSSRFQELINALYKNSGPVAVLIDEYDKPILDNIGNPAKAEEMREVLKSFYTVLKSCDEYLRFLMLTGISKFSKLSVFSAMNNLRDISMNPQWGTLLGYTQEELESDFAGWIDQTAHRLNRGRSDILAQMKDFYDGFCFDGVHRLYNPFSVLNCLADASFGEYWYGSGSPSFIVGYMRRHEILVPEEYRHIQVDANFADAQEIEHAKPESFLYQAGYLTIENRVEDMLTLDYPNKEVLNAISKTYLSNIYNVEGYTPLGAKLWNALRDGDVGEAVRLFNIGLDSFPGMIYGKAKPSEALYNALFLMLLRGAGATCGGEMPKNQRRADAVALFPHRALIFEFKLAHKESEYDRLLEEGKLQIAKKHYAAPFAESDREITAAAIVVDAQKHQVVRWGA